MADRHDRGRATAVRRSARSSASPTASSTTGRAPISCARRSRDARGQRHAAPLLVPRPRRAEGHQAACSTPGISLQTARKAIEYLREHLGDDLASAQPRARRQPTSCSRRPASRSSTSCAAARACSTSCRSAGSSHELDAEIHELDAARRRDAADARPRPRAGARRREADAHRRPSRSRTSTVRFAHNSERQFAKLLDFYGIAWEYEPRTFTLERDRDGNPAQAFTPDFYLPAYDLYIEITTLNQKLVTKKNRKARRLRRAVPRRADPGALPARLPAPAREVRARAAVAARRRRRLGDGRRAAAARPRVAPVAGAVAPERRDRA